MKSIFSSQLPKSLESLADEVVHALQQQAARYACVVPVIKLHNAMFSELTDPVNGQPSYEGVWRNPRNERCGSMTINSDGSCYAEYDVFCPHPQDTRWFVDMVTAWGREGSVRSDVNLIPSL